MPMSLKDRLTKARSKLSIKTYQRPQLFIIMMMILINIIILIIAAIIALIIDDSFSNFIDAFANGSVKWMLTPNAILLIENPQTLILAVVILVIGMVLFTGTIIALTTNAIKDYFQKKKSGSGKLILDQQIVILNWNNKVPELVADLIHLDKEDISIVILADIDKDMAEKLITNAIKNIKKQQSVINLNILVKHGNPLLKTDLYDVSIDKAKTILIMNIDDQTEQSDPSKLDLNLIKTILNLGEIHCIYQPSIIAEIRNIESKDKVLKLSSIVHSLKEHTIIPICFDRRLGHVIAQTIINPKIKDVYLSMFSFDDAEVYFIDRCNFDDCLNHYSHVIPIANHKEGVFVLAEKEKDLKIKDTFKGQTRSLKTKTIELKTLNKVTIIGSNNKLKFIKASFEDYTDLYQSEFQAKYIADSDIEDSLDFLKKAEKQETILLLSNENTHTSHLDANIINNLIFLQSNLESQPNIIVEVLDPANDHIIKDFNIKNTIISNKIISLLVSKIVLYKETAPFYENLLTIKSDVTGQDDQNISIVQAKQLFDESFPINFDSYKQMIVSFYQSFNQKLMMIGFFRGQKLHMIYGNLHHEESLSIQEDDFIVFIKI